MLMKWSWYVSSTLKTKQCYYVRNTSDLIFSRLWIWAKHNYCWRVLLYLMRRSWRACPWLTRWRSSYASSARSTSWLRRRKRSRRYQTWAQVGGFFLFTSCNSSTVHSICLWCQKQHAELNLFYNLPLVRCSARLTIFARQLEGKYITLSIFDFWWHSLIFVWCCSLGAFSVFLAVMSCLLWYRTCGRAHSRNLLLSEIRLLYDSVKPKFKFVLS